MGQSQWSLETTGQYPELIRAPYKLTSNDNSEACNQIRDHGSKSVSQPISWKATRSRTDRIGQAKHESLIWKETIQATKQFSVQKYYYRLHSTKMTLPKCPLPTYWESRSRLQYQPIPIGQLPKVTKTKKATNQIMPVSNCSKHSIKTLSPPWPYSLKPLQKLIGAWLRNTNRITASPIATMAHRDNSIFSSQSNHLINIAFCNTLLLIHFSYRLPNLVITFPNPATRCTPDSSCGTPKPERDGSGKAGKYWNKTKPKLSLLLRRSRN